MPANRGRDSQGCYFRWGDHGKKYYYIAGNITSREYAKNKSLLQGRAIHASQGRRRSVSPRR